MHGGETTVDANGMIIYEKRSPRSFIVPPMKQSDASEFWVNPLLEKFQNLFA